MVQEKEYRIVLPISVDEYRIAQVYMTSRTSLMEAESADGAGVEILANRAAEHPKLGAAQYTKKVFHIDKRFPAWMRMIAPKSGSTLVEESYNAFPHTLTEISFPMFSSFRIVVESHHLPDRGERYRLLERLYLCCAGSHGSSLCCHLRAEEFVRSTCRALHAPLYQK